MRDIAGNGISIRQLSKDEAAPYDLLLDADPSRELVDRYLPASDVYVAILNNEVAGVYVLYPVSSDVIEIKNIAVRENLQGKGIGKAMLADAEKKAREAGRKIIIIGTGNSSVGQLYLYQKMGFEIAEIRKDFFINNYTEALYENGIQVKHMIMLAKIL